MEHNMLELEALRKALVKRDDEIYRLRNGLKWIRHQAFVHFWASAFDPIHMQELADFANDLLYNNMVPPLPDFESAWEQACLRGRQMAKELE
jgi:hypothetical protein